MKVLSSAHVHTTYCDGKTPAPLMARAALEKGFVSLGFSSHAPQRFDPGYCVAPEKEEDYKKEILSLREQYKEKMAVYLGIERDYFSCVSPDAYDYFIASVHYFLKPDGHHTAIDGHPEDLKSYVDDFCRGDGLRMAEAYFSMLRDYVLSSHPQIIGHFDLIRKNNASLHLYDEASKAYQALALDALRDISGSGALLEVNTGAMARGYLTSPYPDAFLLSAWREWGGDVIINSDCHDVRFLDAYFDEAEQLLSSLGYRWAVRLGKDQIWEHFPL